MTGQVLAMYVMIVAGVLAIFQAIFCMAFKLKLVDCVVVPMMTLTGGVLSGFWYYAAYKMINSRHLYARHAVSHSVVGVDMSGMVSGCGLHVFYGIGAIGLIVVYYAAIINGIQIIHITAYLQEVLGI